MLHFVLKLGLAFAEGFVEVLVFMILALSAVSGTATTSFLHLSRIFQQSINYEFYDQQCSERECQEKNVVGILWIDILFSYLAIRKNT